jgi:hypothetical protein
VTESERWALLKADTSRDLGLSIESTVTEWRRRVVAERCTHPQSPARLADAEEATRAQEALATLAARPWRFDGWYRAWPLRLDAASRAPLAILPGHGEREGLHVVANLGAGRLLRIQVGRFPGEQPTEIVKCYGDLEVDGGDAHLWFDEVSDPFLEGSALPARERRRRDD